MALTSLPISIRLQLLIFFTKQVTKRRVLVPIGHKDANINVSQQERYLKSFLFIKVLSFLHASMEPLILEIKFSQNKTFIMNKS